MPSPRRHIPAAPPTPRRRRTADEPDEPGLEEQSLPLLAGDPRARVARTAIRTATALAKSAAARAERSRRTQERLREISKRK